MQKYTYKKFLVNYYITPTKLNTYQAHGSINLEKPPLFSKEFQTESNSSIQATSEIKKLMENFIDFEWEQKSLLSNEENK